MRNGYRVICGASCGLHALAEQGDTKAFAALWKELQQWEGLLAQISKGSSCIQETEPNYSTFSRQQQTSTLCKRLMCTGKLCLHTQARQSAFYLVVSYMVLGLSVLTAESLHQPDHVTCPLHYASPAKKLLNVMCRTCFACSIVVLYCKKRHNHSTHTCTCRYRHVACRSLNLAEVYCGCGLNLKWNMSL